MRHQVVIREVRTNSSFGTKTLYTFRGEVGENSPRTTLEGRIREQPEPNLVLNTLYGLHLPNFQVMLPVEPAGSKLPRATG